ncbi:hypothetical protein EB118_24425, partial [bacterium]|nr:hypothetical protein [bacterium]
MDKDELTITAGVGSDISALSTVQISEINLSDLDTITIDTSPPPLPPLSSVNLNNGYLTSNGSYPQYTFSNNWSNISPGLDVKGDASIDGDIKWKGRSLGKLLEKIEDRLAILPEPDPAKL